MANDQSFLPEDYLARKVARRTNIICVTLFIVVMTGVISAFYVTDQQRREVEQLHDTVDAQFEEAARRLDQLSELQTRKKEMLQKARITGALVERTPRSILLSELINHMPASMTLLDFELATRTLNPARHPRTAIDRAKLGRKQQEKEENGEIEVPPTEMTIDLTGVANSDVDVAQFMTSMRAHPLYSEVSLVFSEQSELEEMEIRKFRIQMSVNQEFDVMTLEPTRIARGLEQNPMDDEVKFPNENRSASHPTN
ncbi:MAG: PilN domain-containing protein [Phycisphaeraceae bacterium]